MNHEFGDHIEEVAHSLMITQEHLLQLMDSVVRMRLIYMRSFSTLTEEDWNTIDNKAQNQLDLILLSITRLSDRIFKAQGDLSVAHTSGVTSLAEAEQLVQTELERYRKKDEL